jgi:hypothetical protein
MSYWSCELDMTRSLATNLRGSHLDTTSLTYNTLVADSFVFATGTLVVLAWAKNLLTEESTTFRALRTVVDRLRDENLSIRESSDIILVRESDGDGSEIVERFSLRDVSFSSMFTDLRVVGDFVIEKVFEIFCHWEHRLCLS